MASGSVAADVIMLMPTLVLQPASRRLAMRRMLVCQFLAIAILSGISVAASRCCQAQEAKKKTWPEAVWVDPNQSDANCAKYHTFASKTIGGKVTNHIDLPPQYDEQPSRRVPVIYWLHGLGGN